MAGYKIATYKTPDGPRAGLVIDDKVFDAAKLTGKPAYTTVLGILEDWRSAQAVLKKAAANAGKSRLKPLPLGRAKLLAPIRWPSAIYCAGANYADHAAEMARRMNRPPEPDPHTQGLKAWHFIKAARTLADPGATVKISDVSDKVDWEVELAAVIGRPARNVSQEKALSYVAGYTAANDLSARDRERGRRPAESRPQAVGERRPQAGFQQQGHDLQPGRADRTTLEWHDAPPGRPDPDGNTGRRRLGARRVPESWRRGQNLDREDRDLDQQASLTWIQPRRKPAGRHVIRRCRTTACRWLHSTDCNIQAFDGRPLRQPERSAWRPRGTRIPGGHGQHGRAIRR
jgi:hypothetical protein